MNRRLVVGGLISMAAMVCLAMPASAAPSGSATINPNSGPAGTTFNVNGTVTCTSNTMVIALVHGGTTRTSSTVPDGGVNTNLTVPAGNPPEADDVTATCDGSSLTLGTFTVTAPPTTTTSTTSTTTTTAPTTTTIAATTTTAAATSTTAASAPATSPSTSSAASAPATTAPVVGGTGLARTGFNTSWVLLVSAGCLVVALVMRAARRQAHADR